MNQEDVLLVLTARSGSKGINRKNIYPLLGRPLISYSLEAIQKTGIKNAFLSTDDDSIKNIASKYNIKIVNRKTDISLSDTPSVDVVLDLISDINFTPKYIVLIQPTSPMVYSCDILEAIKLLHTENYDSVISVYKSHYKIWQQQDHLLYPVNHDAGHRSTRQQSEPMFIETGSIYTTKFDKIVETKQLISGNVGFVDIPKIRSFEIDDYEDLKIIESIMSYEKDFFNL